MDANLIVNLATPIVVPLVIAATKKFLPKVPTWMLPILAPILGGLMGALAAATLHTEGNIWVSAILGLAGVGVREIKDQLTPEPVKPA